MLPKKYRFLDSETYSNVYTSGVKEKSPYGMLIGLSIPLSEVVVLPELRKQKESFEGVVPESAENGGGQQGERCQSEKMQSAAEVDRRLERADYGDAISVSEGEQEVKKDHSERIVSASAGGRGTEKKQSEDATSVSAGDLDRENGYPEGAVSASSRDRKIERNTKNRDCSVSIHPRFGFVVSKKVGNAVMRNKLRRRLSNIALHMAKDKIAGVKASYNDAGLLLSFIAFKYCDDYSTLEGVYGNLLDRVLRGLYKGLKEG